jgi:hypothetical protein
VYFMYVDESGDSGVVNSPTRYFVLSGLVLHELRWQAYLDHLIQFRRTLKQTYGFRLREEFHAGAMITRPGTDLMRIKKHHRLAMIRHFADNLAAMTEFSIINVVIDKQGKRPDYDVFEMAWKALIQRFENTLSHHNFPGPRNADDRGLLVCDHTEDKKVTMVMRRMRKFNPVPHHPAFSSVGHRNLPVLSIVEDPNFRDSEHSFFIQAVDLAAFLVYQSMAPNRYMRKNSGQNYYRRLGPIFCTHASRSDPYGFVRL